MEIKREKLLVDKSILVLLAGLMWCGVGVLLISYAVTWLSVCDGKEQLFFYPVGFLAAIPVHYFGFQKIADKNLNRILPLTDKKSPFSFMTPKSYIIVIIMISMGIALRHSSIPKRYLSILYNGIGLALFLSGLRYLRFFAKLISEKRTMN